MDSVDSMYSFVKVVDAGSFSGAARNLKIPTSTVSRRISRLENRLGVQLLLRTTRKLSLTDVGRAYYLRCKRIIEEIQEAEEAISQMNASPKGTLRVTGPVDMNGVLGQIAAEFLLKYPEIELDLFLSNRKVDLIEEGFDLALRGGKPKDSSMIARKLNAAQTYLVGSPAYFERMGVPETPEDLDHHECMLYETGGVRAPWKTKDGKVLSVNSRLSCNDLLLLRNAALAGLGLVRLPVVAIANELEDGSLQTVLEDYIGFDGGLYAMYPSSQHLSPKVRVFLDFIIQFFQRDNLNEMRKKLDLSMQFTD